MCRHLGIIGLRPVPKVHRERIPFKATWKSDFLIITFAIVLSWHKQNKWNCVECNVMLTVSKWI